MDIPTTSAEYPREYSELAAQIESYRNHAESGDFPERRKEWEATRDNMKAFHGRNLSNIEGVIQRPSANLLWLQSQIQFAKIVSGQDFRPSVSALDAGVYDASDRRKLAVAQVADAIYAQDEPDAAAKMRQAVLRSEYEHKDLLEKYKALLKMAQWFGDGYILVTWDGDGCQYDILHPDDVRHDPDAMDIQDGRYASYGVRTRLNDVKRRFPKFADMIKPADSETSLYAERISEPHSLFASDESQENTYLECWYIRDDSMVTARVDEVRIEDPAQLEAYEADGWQIDPELTEYLPQITAGTFGAKTVDVPVAWTMYLEDEVPEFPGGWRKVHYCCGVILDDPDEDEAQYNDVDIDLIPLAHMRYFDVPGEAHGMGIGRHIRPIAEKLDDLIEIGSDISEEMTPYVLKMPGKLTIDSSNALAKKTKKRVFTMEPRSEDKDLDSVVRQIPGAELPISFQNFMGQLNNYADVLGGGQLRGNNNIPRDASDQFVRAIEDADHARVAEVRANLKAAAERVYEITMAYYHAYHTKPRYFDVDGGYKSNKAAFCCADLDGKKDYVITVGGSSVMPHDPIEKNAFIKNTIDALASSGSPTLAFGQLELMDIDNKPAIKALLEQFFQEQAQQAQAAAENAPAISPDEQQRYREGASDVLEQLGKEYAEIAPQVSLVIAEQLQNASMGAEIDYNKIDQVIHDFRPQIVAGDTRGIQ